MSGPPITSPPPPPPTSVTPDASENLRLMMDGRLFDRFFFAPSLDDSSSGEVQVESIFLWYEPSMKLGTFYWCAPGMKEKVENLAIPLSSISDIFLGRQTPELKSLAASGGSADQCFSITSKRHALHLRGESAAIRSAFLAGIRHVWTKPTMVTQSTANITSMTTGAPFSQLLGIDPTEKREIFVWYDPVDSKLGTIYWCDAGRKERVAGQSLQLHRISDVYLGKQAAEMKGEATQGHPSNCCFSIIAKDKSLHLIAGSEAVRTTWLAGVRDVFANVGKKASDSKETAARKQQTAADKERRRSRSSNSNNSNNSSNAAYIDRQESAPGTPGDKLQTPSKETKLQQTPLHVRVPSENGPIVPVNDAASPSPLPQQHQQPQQHSPPYEHDDQLNNELPADAQVLHSPTTAAAVQHLHQIVATDVRPKTTLLEAGHHFTAFVGFDPTEVLSYFVWYDDREGKLGTLYWNDSKDSLKVKVPQQSIPFHRISDVFMGKQSNELKSTAAANFATSVCFSVVSKEKALHMAAESEAVRVEFLSNIKNIFVQFGKKVDEERSRVERQQSNAPIGVGLSSLPLPSISSPYLETGHHFSKYDDQGERSEVFLWYENAGTELGYLYWNQFGVKEIIEHQRLAVPFISDIYMGKQAAPLDQINEASDNCCWSLVSNDRSLHLQSHLPSQRTEWLSALRDLFVLAGKRTQQEAQELVIQQALLDNPKRGLLMKGAMFTAFFGKQDTIKQEVLVWYAPEDAKLGTLYWSSNGEREKNSERGIPLHRVSDVFMGKQTAELKSDAARDIPTNRCFSILTKDRGLHMAAESEAQRGDWLSAIKSVFLESGKKVDDDQRRKAKESQIAPAQVAALEQNKQLVDKEAALSTTPLPAEFVPAHPLHAGRDYLAISAVPAVSGGVTYVTRPVFVFFERHPSDRIGRLYWCDRGQREMLESQYVPLSKVSDVFLGKQTDETRSTEAARYESKQCVSVVTRNPNGHDLHLITADEKARDEFTVALRAIFAYYNKPGPNLNDPTAIVIMMEQGEEFTSYIGSGIIGSSIPGFVWYVKKDGKLGTIYWSEGPQAKKEKVEGNSLAINHITDVFLGKKTPELLSVEGLFANSDHCLSIMSKKNSIHMEFKSPQMRDAWLTGVKNAYAAAGRPVKESKPGDQPGTRVTTIVAQKSAAGMKVSPILIEGRPFVRYQMVDQQIRKRKIHLWLAKDDGDRGSLYWEDLQEKKQPLEKKAENSIPVNKITDVYMGKQTSLLLHPELATVPADCCFSVATKDQNLDLAAKYPHDRKIWLTAVHSIFVSSGKKVVNTENQVSKIEMDQPVWTPFGEGLAARYPRHDNITSVQLDYGIAYVNLESIHRLVHVNTPLGQGILLPFDKTRVDDTVPVQLPWGVSYVIKRDIKPMKSTSAPVSRDISPRTSVQTSVHTSPTQPLRVLVGAEVGNFSNRSGQTTAVPSTVHSPSNRLTAQITPTPTSTSLIRTNYSKEEALGILRKGTPFSLITTHGNVPVTIPIVGWLASDEGVLGTLYYNPAGNTTNRADHSIPVHQITDVYLGDIHFPATPSTPSLSNRALSIVGRGEEWNLLAESTDTRNAWYYSLHALISSSGKDVKSEEKPSPVASESGHHFQYQKPAEPDYDEATTTLQQGVLLTQHIITVDERQQLTAPPKKRWVYIWYDSNVGDLGSLYTTRVDDADFPNIPAAEYRVKDGVWSLADIRDLFLGNRNFRKNVSERVENDHCLSLVLHDKQELNLEAKNKSQRDQLFYSVVSVLKNGPKMDTEDEDEDDDLSRRRSTSQQQSAQQEQEIKQQSPMAPPTDYTSQQQEEQMNKAQQHHQQQDLSPQTPSQSTPAIPVTPSTASPTSTSSSIVADGLEMTVWSGDDKQSVGTRQFVYWDPPEGKRRLGTLYWCQPDERVRVEGQELPLHYISDVFLGRHSNALKAPTAANVPSATCFVLVSKNLTFSAQTNSEKEREQWLKSFKKMFTMGGKAVIDQKKKAANSQTLQQTPSSNISTYSSNTSNTAPTPLQHREPIA